MRELGEAAQFEQTKPDFFGLAAGDAVLAAIIYGCLLGYLATSCIPAKNCAFALGCDRICMFLALINENWLAHEV